MESLVPRRDNRKKGAGRRRPRLLAWLTVVLVLCSASALALNGSRLIRLGRQARDAFLESPYFSVQEIKVQGDGKVGGGEIVALAGMSHGMNIWKIDPALIEKKIGTNPWVKRVLVRRELPHRVVIDVGEREVKAIVALGKLYYVDADGYVFKEVEEGEGADFPLLTGLQQADLESQPRAVREKIREVLELIDLTAGGPLALSEIHFSPRGGVILYPMAYPVAFYMGWGDWRAKMQRLGRVLDIWKGKETQLVSLDMSFRDRVVARMRRTKS